MWPGLRLAFVLGLFTGVGWSNPATPVLHLSPLRSLFEQTGARFTWTGPSSRVTLSAGGVARIDTLGRRSVTLVFPGSDARAVPVGEGAAVQVRYYTPHYPPGAVRERVPLVRYRNLYPGIDLIFRATPNSLEYDFELTPEADPGLIRMAYRGASRFHLDSNNNIVSGAVIQRAPTVYQIHDGVRTLVPCRYVLTASGDAARLDLKSYDRRRPLVIDPVLNFSDAIGGGGFDSIYATAVDNAGNIYIAGETDSASFVAAGTHPDRDAFVAKLDPGGATFLYVTFFGGTGYDAVRGLAVDASGNAYAAGGTNSFNFPVTPGAPGLLNAGLEDAFVAKFSSGGVQVYSTLIGSGFDDEAAAIRIDTSGNAYIAGYSAGAFPTTSGSLQPANRGGGDDCFVAKLNASGSAWVYSTLLGGTGADGCRGIAVDSGGNAYVTGFTYSTDFPVWLAYQTSAKAFGDAFVAEINATGTALVFSTYFGGDSFDQGMAIALDNAGAIYVAGETTSANFPVSTGAMQTAWKGNYDGFVVKLQPGGSAVAYCTLLGGSGSETANSIAVDAAGRAVAAGFTNSSDFPLQQATQAAASGNYDAFVTVIDPAGASLVYSTYVGGLNEDRAYALAISGGRLYLGGRTQSPNFPITNGGTVTATNVDSFLLQISYLPSAAPATRLSFIPLAAPCRLIDTRYTQYGVLGSPYLLAGVPRDFPVPLGACTAIPANAQAYSMNVTVVPHRTLTYLTMWPTGQPQPLVSTLNSFDGRIVANAAIVPAGTSGAISVYASDDTELIVDVNGYFADPASAPSGLVFYAQTPCRIADTRGIGFSGPFGAPYIPSGGSRSFPVLQSSCAPPSAPQAYSLNFTVLPRAGALQYLTVWPSGQTRPFASTLNSLNGQVVANAAIVGAGTGGAVSAYVTDAADLLIDTNGYFAAPGGAAALSFMKVTPCRIADTRFASAGALGLSATRTFDVIATQCGIPYTAQAYSMNITVVPLGPLGWLTVWPTGQPQPMVSTLNSFNGAVVANAAIVPAGTNGQIDVFASNPTHVIIDINGYFAP